MWLYLTTVIKAKNGWLKYDFTVVQEIYYPLALFMGCGVVERHLEMAQPTKKKHWEIRAALSLNTFISLRLPKKSLKRALFSLTSSVTRLDDLLHFGLLLKACGHNYLPKLSTFLGNFYKGFKTLIFLVKSFSGNFLYTFGDFLLVTLLTSWAPGDWLHFV